MISLCENRPEGFGPASALHPRLPTTCFLDVVVEPLATWLFLLLTIALVPLRIRSARHQPSFSFKPESQDAQGSLRRRGIASRILSVLYYVLLVALLAMVSLEIARLVVAELGIGLLPFTYVGILLALANRVTWRARMGRLANVAYWLLLAAAMALKTAAEQEEQMGPAIRVKDKGTQGLYPTSDEVIDNAVMVGVEVALLLLEFVGWNHLAR